jgi:GNAT superfamily N-acetyltransferase
MNAPHPSPDAEDHLPAGISAVVPVYNSQETLDALFDRLSPVLRAAAGEGAFEIIFVNDASRDGSWAVVDRICAANPWARGIDLMRNYGQHNALLCGVRAARFDKVVTLDDDLQNPPEEIPGMLAALGEGVDVVYGKPQGLHHGMMRNFASLITKAVLQGAMGAQTARSVSTFRVFRTGLRQAFENYRSPFVSIDVLLTWGTTRFVAIPVKHEPRAAGESNYTLRKLMVHALNMVTGFSTWPLQLASIIGFAVPARPGGAAGAGVCVPGVGHRDLFGGAALRAGRDRRVPGAAALSDDGPADVHRAAARGGRGGGTGAASTDVTMAGGDPASEEAEPCQYLAWDSQFFGLPTGRVLADVLRSGDVARIDHWCAARGVKWLYFLASGDDAVTARCAEDGGFRQVDVRVTFGRTLGPGETLATDGAVGPLQPSDVDALKRIARGSYTASRFYYDGRIPRAKCDELFEVWTASTCQRDPSGVLVARAAGRPLGYVTCAADANSNWGSIGLIGVEEGARGKGVGRALVEAALAWAAARGLAGMTVVTQGRNVPAQRLYQRCGFVTRSHQLYYHKWYE